MSRENLMELENGITLKRQRETLTDGNKAIDSIKLPVLKPISSVQHNLNQEEGIQDEVIQKRREGSAHESEIETTKQSVEDDGTLEPEFNFDLTELIKKELEMIPSELPHEETVLLLDHSNEEMENLPMESMEPLSDHDFCLY